MFRCLLLGMLALCSFCLGEEQYALRSKNTLSCPITRVQYFAERCSGSNYLQQLVKRHFDLHEEQRYGHKHFPAWHDFPWEGEAGPRDFYTLENSEDCLFFVIFRNPYDWIRSVYLAPHHSKTKLRKLSFSRFIRACWELDPRDPCTIAEREKTPFVDHDPHTGEPFENILKLHNAKNQRLLDLEERVDNIYYINYEILVEHPEEVLREIASLFHLKMKEPFCNVTDYKGDARLGTYVKKEYVKIDFLDLIYINLHLDKKIERAIGYDLIWEYPVRLDHQSPPLLANQRSKSKGVSKTHSPLKMKDRST